MQFQEGLEPTFRHFGSVASAIDICHSLVALFCKINMKQQQKLTFFYRREKGH